MRAYIYNAGSVWFGYGCGLLATLIFEDRTAISVCGAFFIFLGVFLWWRA